MTEDKYMILCVCVCVCVHECMGGWVCESDSRGHVGRMIMMLVANT